jgi:hypothetical protein
MAKGREDTPATKIEYIPGVCNIGPAEIGRRRQIGWVGSATTVLLWAAFLIFQVPAPWRLTLFLPAAIGAAGFLQAAFHFCAGFAMRGVFNLGSEVGKTEPVEQAELRIKDRRKARLITLYSLLIAAAVAIAGFFLV